MSLLAALTVKVSAILLLVLAAALCLRTRSAAARHWVLAVGVVAACGAPALHVLPVPPVVRVAPLGAFDWSADTVFDLLGLRPYALFTADADVLGSAVASEIGRFPTRPVRTRGGGRRERPCRRLVGRDDLAGGRGRQRRRAPGRVGETPPAPRGVEPRDGGTRGMTCAPTSRGRAA